MSNDNKKKIEPWRIIVFIIAVGFIIFMWIKKDMADIVVNTPQEQIIPLVATTIAVSLIKIAVVAGVVLLVKCIVSKIKNKKKNDSVRERV